MRVSVFLTGVLLTTLLSLACLTAILVYFEPASSDWMIISLFYLSVFISAAGMMSLLGLIARRISKKSRTFLTAERQVWISFRQGILLAIILVGALIMQSYNLLVWWSLLILVAIISTVEFLSLRKY